MKRLINYILCIITFLFSYSAFSAESIDSILSKIPVLENGRIKPFDTFAKESLQLIYGKKTYNGKPATEVVMTWILLPEHWESAEFVELKNIDLKATLKLDKEKSLFAPAVLLGNERLPLLFEELEGKHKEKEKLNPFFQAVERLENGLSLYKGIVHGYAPHVIPQKEGADWLTLEKMDETEKLAFAKIAEGFVQAIKEGGTTDTLGAAVDHFVELARSQAPEAYGNRERIQREIFYNNFHSFQYAWMLYLLGAVLSLGYFISDRKIFLKLSLASVIGAFIFHTIGFALRIYIAQRPPVSNMYETVIWVPWASVVFSFIFFKVLKNKFLLFAGSMIAFGCMVLADLAPAILDSSVQPLQAVLRSNLWLTIHVMTITVSYGAFFLASILGDVGLVLYAIDETKKQKEILALRDTIYRTLQVGVVLLATGTILGGVWADYSWGRFWGWDPKETWAFISLLGYIAILHGRLAGWVGTHAFMNLAVITFNLIIMAWYGVNFVLGAGKHSYGFGGGGVREVSVYVGLHLIFIIFVAVVRSSRKNQVVKS